MNKFEIDKAIKSLELKEIAEFNSCDSIELRNGKIIDKNEQLDFFKKVSLFHFDDKRKEKFKELYSSDDFYGAWSNLLGNIWQNSPLYKYIELPKKITIGTCYFEEGNVSSKRVIRNGTLDGLYISYQINNDICGACIYQNDILVG